MDQAWSSKKSQDLYNLAHWGNGYFGVNQQGHLIVKPYQNNEDDNIDLFEIAKKIQRQQLSFPVLVRFKNILQHRIQILCLTFNHTIAKHQYQGNYTIAYPIKVNQQRCVIEDILATQDKYPCITLEAGSKSELMIILALAPKNHFIICNGYKDSEYIQLALLGQKMGHTVYIVIEKLSELSQVFALAGQLGIRPHLGIRIRLASVGEGKWQNTGGEKSKFGLTTQQILQAIQQLKQHNALSYLHMLHFHLGSQIPNIHDIEQSLQEVARYYIELSQQNIQIHYINVGGGLGVDYEGTRSRSYCSVNYTITDYAEAIITTLQRICQQYQLPHPHLITESGRAITAHHAVLITNVIDSDNSPNYHIDIPIPKNPPLALKNLMRLKQKIQQQNPLEAYHNANYCLQQVRHYYLEHGLELQQLALAEKIYYNICHKIFPLLDPACSSHQQALNELQQKLACKIFCNFSVFQSTPDLWAIDQIFPITPLHQLDKKPTQASIIQDITCDSDGCIKYYVENNRIQPTLSLHPYQKGDFYLLGIFLVGAYQEILGDRHNLFGDTNTVNVELTSDGDYQLIKSESGDTVSDLLDYVHFKQQDLIRLYQEKLAMTKLGTIEQNRYLELLKQGLLTYSYLQN